MDRVKFRKLPIKDTRTPDLSITPVGDGKYHLFGEKSGLTIGTFSRKYLIERKILTPAQIDAIKGTTNFIRVSPKFSMDDLNKIELNTQDNNHSENYVFIARKINSPLLKEFQEIAEERDRMGYLTMDVSNKQMVAYQKLMNELKRKVPNQYQQVYSRL